MTSRTERYLIANLTRGTFDGVYEVISEHRHD
jgi:hypothetical protein